MVSSLFHFPRLHLKVVFHLFFIKVDVFHGQVTLPNVPKRCAHGKGLDCVRAGGNWIDQSGLHI